MNGLPGMGGVKVVTGAAAAVLLMAYMGLTPALADTIEAALVRAYQNNPQLNAQRAAQRRSHGLADAVHRPANRQQAPGGGEPGLGRARSATGSRTDAAPRGGHDLHGLSARFGHR